MAKDVHQVIALGTSGGEYWEFVQHFQGNVTSSSDPVLDGNDLIDTLRDQFEGNFMACVPSQVILTGYKAKRVNNTGGPTVMRPITAVPGTRSGTLAAGCIGPCIVSMYTNLIRWNAGKLFLPGVASVDVTSNHFTSGLLTAVDAVCNVLSGVMAGGIDWEFVIWSHKFTSAFIPYSIDISLKAGIQKRRLLPVI